MRTGLGWRRALANGKAPDILDWSTVNGEYCHQTNSDSPFLRRQTRSVKTEKNRLVARMRRPSWTPRCWHNSYATDLREAGNQLSVIEEHNRIDLLANVVLAKPQAPARQSNRGRASHSMCGSAGEGLAGRANKRLTANAVTLR